MMKRIRIQKIIASLIVFVVFFSGITYCSNLTTENDTAYENAHSSLVTAFEQKIEDGLVDEISSFDSEGSFNFKTIGRFLVVSDYNGTMDQTVNLAADLYNASGIFRHTIKVRKGALFSKKDGDIILIAESSLPEEGYKTIITEKNVLLFFNGSGNCNGLFYAAQRLLQLFMQSDNSTVACKEITESPNTPERTLMLDCARKFWSVKWVKNMIAQLSWMGFNALELHMTEDQGIRCNIWKDKSGRTVLDCNGNDFSFICGGTEVSWNKNYKEDTKAYWSRDDIIEIIEYAQKYHIEIIPSVDLPCHSKNLVVRTEQQLTKGIQFQYNGNQYSSTKHEKIAADGSYSNTIDIANDFTRNMSLAITQAYAAFFKEFGCTKFGISADEVVANDASWRTYAVANKGETAFDGFIIYINSLCEMLKAMDYSVRANNDFLFSEKPNVTLDQDLEICYWLPTDKSYGSAEYLLGQDRTVYNCVSSYCYYALRQSNTGFDARDPNCGTWVFHHSTAKRIYSGCNGACGFSACNEHGGWNPSKLWGFNSKQKTTVTDRNLGGCYFYIWSDWAKWDTEENIMYRQDEYGLILRMWSSAAKMWDWDADQKTPWDAFRATVLKFEYSPGIKNR